MSDGRPYPENRDWWGTLWVNASSRLEDHPRLRPLVEALAEEFDR